MKDMGDMFPVGPNQLTVPTKARIARRSGSGSVGHALTTRASPGSVGFSASGSASEFGEST